MTRILALEQIKKVLDPLRVISALEEGFVAYSEGRVNVPPVGHLCFEDPPGDCHIKYGCVPGDESFVVKVATGFYRNPEIGLPSSNGVILVFSQKTGRPEAILLDEGWLTDTRTAVAGAIAAKYLAPHKAVRIGIIGTGTQARRQLEWLARVIDSRDVAVWGRSEGRVEQYRRDMQAAGFSVHAAADVAHLCNECDLVVSATAARQPLIFAEMVRPGMHITALGADGGGKQELEAEVFTKADVCVVDSLAQCSAFGDASYALRKGVIAESRLVELGRVIRNPDFGRQDDAQITIADLTGVAVQDIQIAKLILEAI